MFFARTPHYCLDSSMFQLIFMKSSSFIIVSYYCPLIFFPGSVCFLQSFLYPTSLFDCCLASPIFPLLNISLCTLSLSPLLHLTKISMVCLRSPLIVLQCRLLLCKPPASFFILPHFLQRERERRGGGIVLDVTVLTITTPS